MNTNKPNVDVNALAVQMSESIQNIGLQKICNHDICAMIGFVDCETASAKEHIVDVFRYCIAISDDVYLFPRLLIREFLTDLLCNGIVVRSSSYLVSCFTEHAVLRFCSDHDKISNSEYIKKNLLFILSSCSIKCTVIDTLFN